MATEIHLQASSPGPLPRVKVPPQATAISVPFAYSPSDDGTDENLLVLLHGLGDTHIPFAKLGRSFKLPQTATIAIRAPEQIPFLYEEAFQWYTSFTPLGELITKPNPTSALNLLSKVLNHLIQYCQWPPGRIHLLGFAQGGSVAGESGVKWWKSEIQEQVLTPPRPLGSIVSISGPLLEYPTLSKLCATPILVFHRPASADSKIAVSEFHKAFVGITEVKRGGDDGMPRSKDEWTPIMEFWSRHLGRRQVEGLYEVMTGTSG